MKNMLFINTIRKIKDTHKKFLSLMCLALLGVGFYVGIKSSSPDMLDTLDKYLQDNNVYDLEITSTFIFAFSNNTTLPTFKESIADG